MEGLDLFSAYAGGVFVAMCFMFIISFTSPVSPQPNQKVIMVLVPPFWPIMIPFLVLSAIVQAKKQARAQLFKGKNNDRNYH